MSVYKQKGSKYWWFKFVWKGELIRESTNQTNKQVAKNIEAAKRIRLAKQAAGIEDDREPAPTLKEFADRFKEEIRVRCAAKPRTVSFYEEKLSRLLEYAPLADAPLDQIDEAVIDEYVQYRRQKVAPATVNRQLATLRRALRLAYRWKVISRLPQISLLPGERNREFVLSRAQEPVYLAAVPQPLADLAVLLLDTGLRVGEALNLQTPDIHLEPAPGAKFGYLHVRDGKSKYAKRNVSLTARVTTMLRARLAAATSLWVFDNGSGAPWLGTSLNHQHTRVRTLLKLPPDFVIHSFRHTMLTRLGESGADAFTIMRIAGHSSVTVSQRYVHPSPESLERAFEKLEACNAAAQAPKVGVGIVSGIAANSGIGQNPANALQ